MGKLYYRPVSFVDKLVKTDRKLLKLVRQQPILYDKRHPQFKARREKNKVWETISKTLGYTDGAAAKLRWLHLIDKFHVWKFSLNDMIRESMEQFMKKKESPSFSIDELEGDVITNLFAEPEAEQVPHQCNQRDILPSSSTFLCAKCQRHNRRPRRSYSEPLADQILHMLQGNEE